MKKANIKKIIIDKKGKRFLPIEKCGISPLIILLDAIPLTKFEGDKKVYVGIAEILKWIESEIPEHEGESKEILKQNKAFLEKLNVEELKNG